MISYLYSRLSGCLTIDGQNREMLIDFCALIFVLSQSKTKLNTLHQKVFSNPIILSGGYTSRRRSILKLCGIPYNMFLSLRRQLSKDEASWTKEVFMTYDGENRGKYFFERSSDKRMVYEFYDPKCIDSQIQAMLLERFVRKVNESFV